MLILSRATVQQIAVILQHEIQNSKTKIYIVSFQMALELGYLKGGYVNFWFWLFWICIARSLQSAVLLSIAGWLSGIGGYSLFYGLHNCMDCIGHERIRSL